MSKLPSSDFSTVLILAWLLQTSQTVVLKLLQCCLLLQVIIMIAELSLQFGDMCTLKQVFCVKLH